MTGRRAQWTGAGTPAVEALLTDLAEEAACTVRERLPSRNLVVLAVIGGYGRGEGGVERVAGELRPHNNVDLLLVTRGLSRRARADLARALNRALADVAERYGLPVDLGVIDARTLRHTRRHVLWYDVREGHRTIAGDPGFLAANVRFGAGDIDPRDVRDLVVNRGALLLINRLALRTHERAGLPADWRKRVVRHAMKAVVGYGDALLYTAGAYHWSYREKARRVRRCALIDEALGAAYERAIEFRFQPDYADFADRELGVWIEHLLSIVEPAHQRFLRAIHGRTISWSEYPGVCLAHSLARSVRSVRDWARCAKNALAVRGRAPVSDMRLHGMYVLAGAKDRLAAVFPDACYGLGGAHPLVRALLSESADSDRRRRRFLALWAIDGDVNIPDEVRALSHEPQCERYPEQASEAS